MFFYKYKDTLYSKNQLEFFRIGIAAFSILSLIFLLLDYSAILHPDGIINWELSSANSYLFEFHLKTISDISGIKPNIILNTSIIIYFITLIFLLIGIYTKYSSILSFIFYVVINNITSSFCYGVDIYQGVSLFLMCIFPIGYSISFKKKQVTSNIEDIKKICIRVLQIYLIITYTSAGWEKIVQKNWWNGSFMYMVISDSTLSTISNYANVFGVKFYKFISHSILVFESFYFIAIWIPYLRVMWFTGIIIIHLYIILFLSMPFFGLIMIILNFVCWYPHVFHDVNCLIKKNEKNIHIIF